MTDLSVAIETAVRQNEKKIAAEIGIPKVELDTEGVLMLRHFAAWAKSRGVKCLPCAPTSAAAFIRSESAVGVSPERIIRTLEAIEAMHDNAGLANPIATAPVRAELARIFKVEGPRSWNKAERLVFAGLPIEAKAIIARHAKLDSDAVRRAQNETAELRKQIHQKGIEQNGTSYP